MAFLGVWLCGKNDTPHNDTTTQPHNHTSPHKKRPNNPQLCLKIISSRGGENVVVTFTPDISNFVVVNKNELVRGTKNCSLMLKSRSYFIRISV
jgi:hypothetical protein